MNKVVKTIQLFRRLSLVLVIFVPVLLSRGCCDTDAVFSVVVGETLSRDKEYRGTEVWICPGEAVTFGWWVSGDVTQATLSTVGNIDIPTGSYKAYPTETTIYTLTAKGECEVSRTCTVNVHCDCGTTIQNCCKGNITAKLVDNKQNFYYESNSKQEVWSSNIILTSIKMSQFNPFLPDTSIWNNPLVSWHFNKTNIDGEVFDFDVKWTFTTPWSMSAEINPAGVWKLYPNGFGYPKEKPPFANFEFTYKCLK